MRPKGKLFALLAIFAAIGLVTATGAFTTVSATRTAQVNVAGDSAALLQLQPTSGPNGYNAADSGSPTDSHGYAQLNNNDELEINLGGFGSNVAGSGPNVNATTDLQAVFNITNQGTQEVNVSVDDDGPHQDLVTFYNATGFGGAGGKNSGGLETNPGSGESTGSVATLGVGQTLVVSIYVDTTGQSLSDGDQLISNVTITADATS